MTPTTCPPGTSEAATAADFTSVLRYAQCWEDADVLLAALEPKPGGVYLSIASAGDNTFSLLSRAPERVVAIDMNPAQLACVRLRAAAYRHLQHPELLTLLGSVPATPDVRLALWHRLQGACDATTRAFWEARLTAATRDGFAGVGKLERYFATFRRRVLPLVHRRRRIEQLLAPRPEAARRCFYHDRWNTWRWRLLFAAFFSRRVMGLLGRDPALFRYVQGSVARPILARVEHALVHLEPAANPYLRWILHGRHGNTPAEAVLPHALRPENFESIRDNLDRLETRRTSLEAALKEAARGTYDGYNLSDVFEYVAEPACLAMLQDAIRAARPGGRLVYWNMLAPRQRPEVLAARLEPLTDLARRLHASDKAFFYSRLVIEKVS